MDLIHALRQQFDVVNLLQCLESFALVVTKDHAPAQVSIVCRRVLNGTGYSVTVRQSSGGWSMHDLRRVSDHHCLNYVLLHLNDGWRGLHVMVAMYLRKYWASNGDQMPA